MIEDIKDIREIKVIKVFKVDYIKDIEVDIVDIIVDTKDIVETKVIIMAFPHLDMLHKQSFSQ